MCGICGFYSMTPVSKKDNIDDYREIVSDYIEVAKANSIRGLDAYGYLILKYNADEGYNYLYEKQFRSFASQMELFNRLREDDFLVSSIANFRAIPTPEFQHLTGNPYYDIQPFYIQDKDDSFLAVVHNGTIYNDTDILNDEAIIRELLPKDKDGKIPSSLVDTFAFLENILIVKRNFDKQNKPLVISDSASLTQIMEIFNNKESGIKGSYAVAMLLPDTSLLLARTYRSLYIGFKEYKNKSAITWFSSMESPLRSIRAIHIRELSPYTAFVINQRFSEGTGIIDYEKGDDDKAVVICSGGLDSTVSATIACKENKKVTLLYFKYGCLAEEKEIKAIKDIADYLYDNTDANVKVKFIDLSFLKKLGGSTIIDDTDNIASGIKGAETHNEWVPARNLVMLSLACAYCDRHKIGKIYTGFNMEEAGAYPDNSSAFTLKLNQAIDVGTISRPKIISPLWNLVKHQIVKLGLSIKAPLHLSWSCYYNKEKHCGNCGPCFMRKKAEEIANKTFTEYLTN